MFDTALFLFFSVSLWMLILLILITLLLFPLSIILIGVLISAPVYKGPLSDHFDGKQFINPGGAKAQGFKEVFQWMMNRKRGIWIENKSGEYGKRPLDFFREGIRITFVNHSTFLIQVGSVNILTDPVWSKRVSPFSKTGPKRMRAPGIRFEDLPRIHLVLLSHNHYDHLDLSTMRLVFGAHHPKIVTPLGVKQYLDTKRISGSTELDWWDEYSF